MCCIMKSCCKICRLCRHVFVSVGAELAAPQNVTVVALNTNYTLTWDWDQNAAPSLNITFTAEYVA